MTKRFSRWAAISVVLCCVSPVFARDRAPQSAPKPAHHSSFCWWEWLDPALCNKGGGGGNGGGGNQQVPEGGSSLAYLAFAGIACLGAAAVRSSRLRAVKQ
jgi:hypothetical protein